MTAPLGTGYPDFGRLASEAQVLEINDINVPIPHNFSYAAKYVGNARALQLWANPPSHGMRLQFQFYGDQGHTVIMDSYVVNLLTGDVVKQPIPILGPWLFIVVQHSDGATNTVTIQLWRTPEMARFAGLEGEDPVFSQNGTPIGASTSVTVDSQFVSEGPAIWVAQVSGNNFAVELRAVKFDGTFMDIDRVNQDASPMAPRIVYPPPWHLRVLVTNFTAAPQTFFLFMTRRHNI